MPENFSDTVPYLDQLERIHQKVIPIQAATADSIYDLGMVHQVVEEYEKERLVYDEAKDCTFVQREKNCA